MAFSQNPLDFTLPPGVTKEEFDAQTRVPAILAGSIVPFGLATLFVFARFYSRLVLTRNWECDDYWVLITWFGSIAVTVLNCLFTNYGTGRHVTVMKESYIIPSLVLAYCTRILYQFVLATTKVAILTLYLRVFSDKRSKHLIYGIIVVLVLYSIPVQLTSIFQCRPISAAWGLDMYSPTPIHCLDINLLLYISTGCNVLLNILLVAFTLPRILPLNIPRNQKIALVCVTSLSSLVILSAIIRVIRVSRLNRSKDFSWDAYDVTTWSAVEINVGIFCAAAPVIKPFIRSVLGAFNSSFGSTPTYPRGNYGSGSRGMELGDGEDFGAMRTSNTYWTPKGAGGGVHLSDSDSTKAVLDAGKITRVRSDGRRDVEMGT